MSVLHHNSPSLKHVLFPRRLSLSDALSFSTPHTTKSYKDDVVSNIQELGDSSESSDHVNGDYCSTVYNAIFDGHICMLPSLVNAYVQWRI